MGSMFFSGSCRATDDLDSIIRTKSPDVRDLTVTESDSGDNGSSGSLRWG